MDVQTVNVKCWSIQNNKSATSSSNRSHCQFPATMVQQSFHG